MSRGQIGSSMLLFALLFAGLIWSIGATSWREPTPTPAPTLTLEPLEIEWETATFTPDLSGIAERTWHPGDRIIVPWTSKPDGGMVRNSDVAPVKLDLAVIGPGTENSVLTYCNVPVAVQAVVQTTQIRTPDPTVLQLPTDLTPGIYAIRSVFPMCGKAEAAVLIHVEQTTPTTSGEIEWASVVYKPDFRSIADHTWHPGDVITIPWIVESGGMIADSQVSTVTLDISLIGPAIKSSGDDAWTNCRVPVVATAVAETTQIGPPPDPVVFHLPSDVVPGIYALRPDLPHCSYSRNDVLIHVEK